EVEPDPGALDADRDGVRDAPAAAEVVEEGVPDEDGDGVADFEDGCPATPRGVEVGADGCAIEPRPQAKPAATDSDGDGVPDSSDACPGTPSGIPIDARGCLARIAPQEEPGEEEAEEPAAFPVPIEPDARDAPPTDAGACLDKSAGDRAIEFDGRRFEPAGFPQPVDRMFLVQVGSFEGIPLFVSDTAEPPYGDFWVPICGETGIYDLYVETGAIP
ncbi:MAG TPA: thrombospondin type 3 repeat-containing protein, partial [Gemmatimonadota bacterium]|nr:thrombospondin type 3 repeat-containing protein [Gemmatimonadota bacterium]